MNYSIVRYFVGWVLLAVGAFMLIPTALALISDDGVGTAFALSASLALAAGLVSCCVKPHDRSMYSKEGFAAVSLGWIAMSLVGALPLWISGFTPSFTDALFEVISGFTTTGASILTDVEALPPSLLLWRSLTHWIGGMGVLMFLLAILPAAGGDNLMLMKAESPGPSVGKLVPRLRKTAVYLYGIYLLLTVLEIILLLLGNMSLLDALCIGLATAGTGGFGVQSDSLASSSTYIQVVVTAFMFIFGVNFNFYFYLIIRRAKAAFGMEEVRWYLVIFAAAVLLVTGCLYADGVYGSVLLCLKYAAFQCASVMTTTGFASAEPVADVFKGGTAAAHVRRRLRRLDCGRRQGLPHNHVCEVVRKGAFADAAPPPGEARDDGRQGDRACRYEYGVFVSRRLLPRVRTVAACRRRRRAGLHHELYRRFGLSEQRGSGPWRGGSDGQLCNAFALYKICAYV